MVLIYYYSLKKLCLNLRKKKVAFSKATFFFAAYNFLYHFIRVSRSVRITSVVFRDRELRQPFRIGVTYAESSGSIFEMIWKTLLRELLFCCLNFRSFRKTGQRI